MYDAREVSVNEETEYVDQIGVTWDDREHLSFGPVEVISCGDTVTTYVALVSENPHESWKASVALAQLWTNDGEFCGALMLGKYEVERLMHLLPDIYARLVQAEQAQE